MNERLIAAAKALFGPDSANAPEPPVDAKSLLARSRRTGDRLGGGDAHVSDAESKIIDRLTDLASNQKAELLGEIMSPIRAAKPSPPNLVERMAAAEAAWYRARGYTVRQMRRPKEVAGD